MRGFSARWVLLFVHYAVAISSSSANADERGLPPGLRPVIRTKWLSAWSYLAGRATWPWQRGAAASKESQEEACMRELEYLKEWWRTLQEERKTITSQPVQQGAGAEHFGKTLKLSGGVRRSAGGRMLLEGEVLPLWGGGSKNQKRDVSAIPEERLQIELAGAQNRLQLAREEIETLMAEKDRYLVLKSRLDHNLTKAQLDFTDVFLTESAIADARAKLKACSKKGWVLGKVVPTWKGYACTAGEGEMQPYLEYKARGFCPDDWPQTQQMIFVENCFALPKRRCLTLTSASFKEPMPFPQSLFDQNALIDENVRWTNHQCKSFECLNTRIVGDCRNCFNLALEDRRWRKGYRGSLPMRDVIAMKHGSLRIGLDAGGGTGSFAAHMARYGVTVMTTAMDIETVKGRQLGLPYMETIALRGLVPLHIPHKSRLPFYDNTLDIIHCVNSVKYLPVLEFEELLFEWDRVLRVGGVMWFEMFYMWAEEMPLYVAVIELLGYNKLYWNMQPKPDFAERVGMHVYLNCVIEKTVRKDPPKRWFGAS